MAIELRVLQFWSEIMLIQLPLLNDQVEKCPLGGDCTFSLVGEVSASIMMGFIP